MFRHKDNIIILTGDVREEIQQDDHQRNAMGVLPMANMHDDDVAEKIKWRTDKDGNAREIYSDRSTWTSCPAGGISIDGKIYVSICHMHWNREVDCRGILIKSEDDGETWAEVWKEPMGSLRNNTHRMVNISFVCTGDIIYYFHTSQYRNSGIFLARSRMEDIGNPRRYQFLSDYDNGEPLWSRNREDAVPLNGIRDNAVGELCVHFNTFLGKWVMTWKSGPLCLSTSDDLFNWSEPIIIARNDTVYPWYEAEETWKPYRDKENVWIVRRFPWATPYGGYIVSEMCRDSKVKMGTALWTPYSSFITEFDIAEVQIKKYLRDNPQVINSKSILKRIIKLEREQQTNKEK
jgi:hypothetical protein